MIGCKRGIAEVYFALFRSLLVEVVRCTQLKLVRQCELYEELARERDAMAEESCNYRRLYEDQLSVRQRLNDSLSAINAKTLQKQLLYKQQSGSVEAFILLMYDRNICSTSSRAGRWKLSYR